MKSNTFSQSFKILNYFLKTAFKCRKTYLFTIICKILLNAIKPFINILFPTFIIGELISQDFNIYRLILIICLFAMSTFLMNMLIAFNHQRMLRHENMVSKELKKLLGKKMMSIRYEYLEDPNILDQISKSLDGLEGYGNRLGGFNALITNFCDLISYIITLFGVIFIIFQVNGVLILALLFIIILKLWIQYLSQKINLKAWEERKRINREHEYYSSLLTDYKYGKDIRLYHCKDLLIEKNMEFLENAYEYVKKVENKLLKLDLISNTLSAFNYLLTYGYIAFYYIQKLISLSQYSLYVSSINQFVNASFSAFHCIIDLNQNLKLMNEYKKFMDIDMKTKQNNQTIDLSEKYEIEFKDVSFAYPNSSQLILKNINIKINPLQKYSIVGENGAGKSTFIKLLMGLYQPTSGEILLNGVNINKYNLKQYYQLFAAVFQDFQLIGYTIGENIACSDQYDTSKIQQILKDIQFNEDRHHLADSVLKRFDDNGVDLSGGENQKLAIARAIYKNAQILVLDEPTAALDPIAEYEIYNQFYQLSENKTSLYISHRLSSCRFCDTILVFDNGQIIEKGTHDELILKDGKYALMFKKQAKYYQDNKKSIN